MSGKESEVEKERRKLMRRKSSAERQRLCEARAGATVSDAVDGGLMGRRGAGTARNGVTVKPAGRSRIERPITQSLSPRT
jgi:hypothetical protein